jgi:aldehyde:ferredoxin oxidoreductase
MRLSEFGSRVVHIDLTASSVEMRPAPEDWLRKYVGGRGLGVRYVLENGPDVDPLSPENILCFMNGPLSGSEAGRTAWFRSRSCASSRSSRTPTRRVGGRRKAIPKIAQLAGGEN